MILLLPLSLSSLLQSSLTTVITCTIAITKRIRFALVIFQMYWKVASFIVYVREDTRLVEKNLLFSQEEKEKKK